MRKFKSSLNILSQLQLMLWISNKNISAVSFTGSEVAGSKVAECCGKNIKKTVLELGGSDPFIVLQDANLNKCIDGAIMSRMINNGQSCIAAKRFIVHEKFMMNLMYN